MIKLSANRLRQADASQLRQAWAKMVSVHLQSRPVCEAKQQNKNIVRCNISSLAGSQILEKIIRNPTTSWSPILAE